MTTTRKLEIYPISRWKPASKQQAIAVQELGATHIMFRPDERSLPLWVQKELTEKGLTAIKIGYTTYVSNTYACVPKASIVGNFGKKKHPKLPIVDISTEQLFNSWIKKERLSHAKRLAKSIPHEPIWYDEISHSWEAEEPVTQGKFGAKKSGCGCTETVGGLARLKEYTELIKEMQKEKERKKKGTIIYGITGSGKHLSAKAIANLKRNP
jgi:hypothetical protein